MGDNTEFIGESRNGSCYSMEHEARRIYEVLRSDARLALPEKSTNGACKITFSSVRDSPYFPIPLKETETAAALKGVEASVATAIARLRYGEEYTEIQIDLEKVSCFLFQAYLAQIGGMGKLDLGVKAKLKDTDLLRAQSDQYRRMSANLYSTKEPGKFYHIHGSLEATKTLNMIGLEAYRPDLVDIESITKEIESHVQRFTVSELEALNLKNSQAGIPSLKYEEFQKTEHGQILQNAAPWSVDELEQTTPPVSFPESPSSQPRQALKGIKVLELCRIIAGPTIGRILAEHGAEVLKVTSPHLSDVPFFQVDCNMSKHTTDLDLKTPEGRRSFENLLEDCDILLDGYRPGALERLGYGPSKCEQIALKRGKGFIYLNENCFGYQGPWAHRPGWQQIADCVSGVAWAQGQFLGRDEPIVPPFPMSDYGAGCMGAIAAMSAVYRRAKIGGSYHCKVSLLQYDLLLFKVGLYTKLQQQEILNPLGPDIRNLRYHHSVDYISGTVMRSMQKAYPHLFDRQKYQEHWYADKYGTDIWVVQPVAVVPGLRIGFDRASRPNGSDAAEWGFRDDGDVKYA